MDIIQVKSGKKRFGSVVAATNDVAAAVGTSISPRISMMDHIYSKCTFPKQISNARDKITYLRIAYAGRTTRKNPTIIEREIGETCNEWIQGPTENKEQEKLQYDLDLDEFENEEAYISSVSDDDCGADDFLQENDLIHSADDNDDEEEETREKLIPFKKQKIEKVKKQPVTPLVQSKRGKQIRKPTATNTNKIKKKTTENIEKPVDISKSNKPAIVKTKFNKTYSCLAKNKRKLLGKFCKIAYCQNNKCRQIHTEQRNLIYNQFWFEKTDSERLTYITKNIEVIRTGPIKPCVMDMYYYFLVISGKRYPICKEMFISSLGLVEKDIELICEDYKKYLMEENASAEIIEDDVESEESDLEDAYSDDDDDNNNDYTMHGNELNNSVASNDVDEKHVDFDPLGVNIEYINVDAEDCEQMSDIEEKTNVVEIDKKTEKKKTTRNNRKVEKISQNYKEKAEKNVRSVCECGKNFLTKKRFFAHKRTCKGIQKTVLKSCDYVQKKSVFRICECNKSFSSRSSYYEHKRACSFVPKKSVYCICECGKILYSKPNFRKHKKICKQIVHKEKTVIKTCKCDKSFSSNTSYYMHRKSCSYISENNKQKRTSNFKCQSKNCSFSCNKRLTFLDHIRDAHSIDSCWEEKIFQNYKEFEDWKEKLEKSTTTAFYLQQTRKTLNGIIKYFICNRSGLYNSQSTGKRAMKSQGSSKIGFNCTACINLKLETNSSVVKINFCNLHYGHENDLSYLRISQTDRSIIANQLVKGIKPSLIQQSIFSKYPNQLQRQHLVTRRDLRNISKAYGIDIIEKPSEDYLSVEDACVQENLQYIFLYKKQGESSLSIPQDDNCPLEKEDFALAIMTDFQRQMLTKFGNDILCLDTTQGTNSYDFKLITVFVIDEFREGIPVAWLICNRQTYVALKLFFDLLKGQVGFVQPSIIMTVKAPQYLKAWTDVFEGNPKKLLCTWHVLHDWQKNLNKIKNKDTASALYKSLCLLLEEPDKKKFYNLLQKSIQKMLKNEYTHDFATYFEAEWQGIEEEWAKCHRNSSEIKTNMCVEAFHKSYGERYLKRKNGRRVDKCINIFLKFEKDLYVKRLVKLEKANREVCSNANSQSKNDNTNTAGAVKSENKHRFQQLTSNENVNLSDLKPNIMKKAVALSELIKKCDSKDLFLNAATHINTATFILKQQRRPDTILKAQGVDGEDSNVHLAAVDDCDVSNQGTSADGDNIDNIVAEAVAHILPEAEDAGDDEGLIDTNQALTIQTDGDSQDANILTEVVEADLPSPGGTRKVILFLQDGTFMMTEMHDDEYQALNITQ